MINLQNASMLSNPVQLNKIKSFRAGSLQLEWLGVNLPAQTMALADLGIVAIQTSKYGQIFYMRMLEWFNIIAAYGGTVRAASAVGAAFNFTVEIPCWYLGLATARDANAWDVQNDWDFDCTNYLAGTAAAKVLSGTFSLRYKPTSALMSYIPKRLFIDETVSTGQSYENDLTDRTIKNIWLYRNTSVIGTVFFSRKDVLEKSTEVCRSTFVAQESEFNFDGRLETFVNDFGYIDPNPTGAFVERVNNKISHQINITTGGIVTIIYEATIENENTNSQFNATRDQAVRDTLQIAAGLNQQNKAGEVKALAASVNQSTSELKAAAKVAT